MMKSRLASTKEFVEVKARVVDHEESGKRRYYVNNTDYYVVNNNTVSYHYNSHFSHPLTLNELARWIQAVPLEERDCEVWSFQGLDPAGDPCFFAPSLERAWEDESGQIYQFEDKEPEGEHKIVYIL